MNVSPPHSFPFCIVWTPIPLITWLLPFVGHMGICKADGTTLDFLGPYHIQVGNFGFGNPTRFLRLNPRDHVTAFNSPVGNTFECWWDRELEHSATFFRTQFYNFCGTNCHSFVAFFLNQINYQGSVKWNSVILATMIFFHASYVDCWAILKTWIPFCLIVPAGICFGGLPYLYAHTSLAVVVLLYFVFYEYQLKAQSKLATRSQITLRSIVPSD